MGRLVVLACACAFLAGCGGGTSHVATPSGCVKEDMPITGTRDTDPPTIKLNPAKIYDVVITTSCGSFTIQLDQAESPHATTSFVSLVQHLFYDATIFHRIWVGTLIQAGDPTGAGTGGPGYTTVDKVPRDAKYTHGVVAMAKTGAAQRGTAGSQFFVVTAANAGLNPDYAIIGKVVKGLDVVDRIGQLGNPDQTATQVIELISARVYVSNKG